MRWDIWIVVFIVGIILSFGVGWLFEDGGMAAAMAASEWLVITFDKDIVVEVEIRTD